MKIIAGTYKNRNIFMPKGIRPTQHIVRKALFDILGQDLEGVTFLELFAGSGSVGLEAVSRGAKTVTFIEKDPKCAGVLRQNMEILGIGSPDFELINSDAFASIKLFERQNRRFDIVFVDPPYGRQLAKKALKTLGAYDILQPNCVAIIQHEKREVLPENEGRISCFRQRKFGASVLSFYAVNSAE